MTAIALAVLLCLDQLHPQHGHKTGHLLHCADTAMYTAKRDRLVIALYNPDSEAAMGDDAVLRDDLDRAIMELTDQILDLAPLSMRRTKENLWITITQGFQAASEHHQRGVTEAADTEDRKEALRAFAEKRSPKFIGR
jgi:enoyl-CoA hydratase/carnithine racemase